MSSIENMTGESGPEVPVTVKDTEMAAGGLPEQKVLNRGLHHTAAENAAKAAATRQLSEPQLASHLETVSSELQEIADAGKNPLDHIDPSDSYVAEAVHSTAKVLDDPHAEVERPITYGDFQQKVKKDNGYISVKQMQPEDPLLQEKVAVLESVLGANGKHQVSNENPNVHIQEAATNMGVTLREVTERGKVRLSVVKHAPSRMRAPVIR